MKDPIIVQMPRFAQRTPHAVSRVPTKVWDVSTMGLVGMTGSPAIAPVEVPAMGPRKRRAWLPSYWPGKNMRNGSRK